MDQMPGIITFTSDFGERDGYVGIVKGVMLSINRTVQIVDLTHQVQAFNTTSAAWIVYNAYNYFPQGTIHLVVVDPGVGSSRRSLLLKRDEHFFIGPDNGIFSLVVQDPLRKARSGLSAFELAGQSSFLGESVSSTFHARDIYGKVAAHLSLGVQPFEFGEQIEASSIAAHQPELDLSLENQVTGRVAHIDNFGNLITDIPAAFLAKESICFLEGKEIGPVQRTYRSVAKGEIVALAGSHGFLEIACCEGRADSLTGACVTAKVTVTSR